MKSGIDSTVNNMIKNMNEAIDKMAEIEKNDNLSDEQKKELASSQMKSFEKYNDVMTNIFKSMHKMISKKEKISKYHMTECIRKHKTFALNALKIDESQKIESFTDDMYNVIQEVLEETDHYRKNRLGKLYNLALKETFGSYKDHVIDIIEKANNQTEAVDSVEEFYGAYFGMVIESVSSKYNQEIEMMEEQKKKAQEEAEERMKKTLNPDMPKADEDTQNVSEAK